MPISSVFVRKEKKKKLQQESTLSRKSSRVDQTVGAWVRKLLIYLVGQEEQS